MTIQTQVPLRLDRIEIGLFQAISAAFNPTPTGPTVAWDYQENSFELVSAGGLVSLSLSAGPAPFIRQGSRGTLLNAVESIPITVTTAVVGERYLLRLNDFDYFHDAVGGDTVTTIRDALVAAVNGDTYETATAADLVADSLTLTADFVGGLRSLTLSGGLSSGVPVDSGESVLVTEGDQALQLQVQTFSKGRTPLEGAWGLTSVVQSALQTPGLVELLRKFGVGLGAKGTPSDLSAIAGGHWSTRTAFSVTLSARSAWIEPVERIESTVITVNLSNPTTSVTFTTPAP
jgi:hypothetical protein